MPTVSRRLNMMSIAEKFLPQLLNDDQKKKIDFLQSGQKGQKFPFNVIKGNCNVPAQKPLASTSSTNFYHQVQIQQNLLSHFLLGIRLYVGGLKRFWPRT